MTTSQIIATVVCLAIIAGKFAVLWLAWREAKALGRDWHEAHGDNWPRG